MKYLFTHIDCHLLSNVGGMTESYLFGMYISAQWLMLTEFSLLFAKFFFYVELVHNII